MAQQMLQGKVVVVGAGAKNLGGLISRTFEAKVCRKSIKRGGAPPGVRGKPAAAARRANVG